MDLLRDNPTHVDTVSDTPTPKKHLHTHADNHGQTHIDLDLLWLPRYD